MTERSNVTDGPTQNYDDPSLGQWRPRPALAAMVRLGILLLPGAVGLIWGLLAGRFASPERLGWPWLLWFVVVSGGAMIIVLALTRVAQRFMPMVALLRLSLIFPDKVPSRFEVARRTYSPAVLQARIDAVRANPGAPLDAEDLQADRLLQLVAALSIHDSRTRGHSERVQAYAALIGHEMGLKSEDASRLSWAALLHDVGKLQVSAETLNSPNRPTPQQWAELKAHPTNGRRLAEPLRDWLGPWFGGIEQHHERWDGGGYPRGLAGEEISLAARIISVADTYDVITSSRSYKKALSPQAAREELTRSAGTQLDPVVVRAFLSISIGRLRGAVSSVASLSSLSALHLPLPQVLSPVVFAGPGTSAIGGLAGIAVALAAGTAGLTAIPAEAEPGPTTSSVRTADPAPASGEHGPESDVLWTGADEPSFDTSANPAESDPVTDSDADAASSADEPDTPTADVPAANDDAGHDSRTTNVPPSNDTPSSVSAGGADCVRVREGGGGQGLDLSGCDLHGLVLEGDYTSSDLTGANLAGASLLGVDLHKSDLTGANLSGAIITSANLQQANLSSANLSGSTVTLSSFKLSTLVGVNLSWATIKVSDLKSANISGAVFDHARFDGSSLRSASGGPASAIAVTWIATTCPSGRVEPCF